MNQINFTSRIYSQNNQEATLKLMQDHQKNISQLIDRCLSQTQMLMTLPAQQRIQYTDPIILCFTQLYAALTMQVKTIENYANDINDKESISKLKDEIQLQALAVKCNLAALNSLLK